MVDCAPVISQHTAPSNGRMDKLHCGQLANISAAVLRQRMMERDSGFGRVNRKSAVQLLAESKPRYVRTPHSSQTTDHLEKSTDCIASDVRQHDDSGENNGVLPSSDTGCCPEQSLHSTYSKTVDPPISNITNNVACCTRSSQTGRAISSNGNRRISPTYNLNQDIHGQSAACVRVNNNSFAEDQGHDMKKLNRKQSLQYDLGYRQSYSDGCLYRTTSLRLRPQYAKDKPRLSVIRKSKSFNSQSIPRCDTVSSSLSARGDTSGVSSCHYQGGDDSSSHTDSQRNSHAQHQQQGCSIVERNARIIKWLYGVKQAVTPAISSPLAS